VLPQPGDHHYGIYLNGNKVGWMRTRVAVGKRVRFDTDLHATVGGMGTDAKVQLTEMRAYDAKSGVLEELAFVQHSSTGEVEVRGERRSGVVQLTIDAGGATTKKTVAKTDTLEDATSVERLVSGARVGAEVSAKRYDPSIQKLVHIKHRVIAVEKKVFGGVEVDTVKTESRYPELGIREITWLDSAGKVLESQVGGFFVARLEPPNVAKKLDFSQDILVSAVVPSPERLASPETIEKMRLRVRGFDPGAPPPTSPRQQVSRDGEVVVLELSKEKPPAGMPIAEAKKGAEPRYLEATAFIQSTAPEIIAAAKKAVGDAGDVVTATSRLSTWVFEHVRDEYVPAYSNALEALKSGRGDCTEHSILFVAMARALGIPARVAVGVAYWPPGNGFGWHAWAEVYAGGSWYTVDPTWGQAIADGTHIKLAEGGPAEQARIVMLLGQLKIDALEVL
jgi:transglutaminase-like putative cysteine protease